MSILIRICQHTLMTDRSNKIIDLTGRFRRALAADWRMTCISFTSFYAFVKFVTTTHTTTCSIFKLYCSIFKQQKFCLYLHTRFFAYFANCRQHNTSYYTSQTLSCVLFVLRQLYYSCKPWLRY